MKVIFTRLAKQELDDASLYYEIQIQGLGTRFRTEVKRQHSESLNILKPGLRKRMRSGNAFCIPSLTSFYILLKKTVY
ncbi:MAG TPA: hypothetical protein PK200_12900 [Spirochaetota bacterium]|nr:hypothetical protein [Spirochaetota bacterium]HQO02745.1 hypothetical protein [Spirochaetota bacterium]HQP49950.1 hypothetical protein [Spirochaetota bacterium]